MSDFIIKAENVGKSYLIGHQRQQGYTALRDVIAQNIKGAAKGLKNTIKGKQIIAGQDIEEFWALREVSFEIQQGDAVGIIGRNGAGKSTLLKVLSRITEPTTGRITLNGRVASLLEVGTGFHPELTGRENIYLNGAILGMGRAEIKKKFEEIVDFSGVEKFLDTPVKRYSSGMYVRLAFSVAAHLEPEILVVDEVLAVGDAEFQRKCLGKMKDVTEQGGRTVLFVSHNMAAVKSLCTKGIVLQNGQLAFSGTQTAAVDFYQKNNQSVNRLFHHGPLDTAPGNEVIRILKFEVIPRTGDILTMNSGIDFVLDFYYGHSLTNIDVTFEVKTQDDIMVFHHGANITTEYDSKQGIYTTVSSLPQQLLNAGIYSVSIIFGENQRYVLFHTKDCLSFEVMQEAAGSNHSKLPGIIFPKLESVSTFKPMT